MPQALNIYEQPFGTKAATQPIMYEYRQQQPSNAILAKQLLHPTNNLNQHIQHQRYQEPVPSTTTLHNFLPLEPVMLPIQGPSISLYENNVPSSSYNIKYHSFPNSQQQVSRKYFQPSGKIFYNQNPYILQNLNRQQINGDILPSQQSQRHHQIQQRLENPTVIDYVNHNNDLRQRVIAQGNTSPNSNNKFVTSQRKPSFHINFSSKVPLRTEGENMKKTGDGNPVKENETEVNIEENFEEDYNSEQHEREPAFSKYSFDYDEDETHDKHSAETDDDDEDDNKRASTQYSTKKFPNKTSKTEILNHRIMERYRDPNSKHARADGKAVSKSVKKPKMMYKSVKYSKEINHSPKIDSLEERHSENVPVTHKHRILKEKWYLSENTNDNREIK